MGCSVNVLGEPLSGVFDCFLSVMLLEAWADFLLLAVLLGLLLPVKLRFELFEPKSTLCDDPWKVSPLSPVWSAELSDEKSAEAGVGSSRLTRFRRDWTSAAAAPSPPRSETEPDCLSLLGTSVVVRPRDEVRLGIRRREEADEALRSAEESVGSV